jgi:uroporphyrinogen III methyltransferase/synthase
MGSVTLVGAGCGRDLITLKGLKAVRSADVIVYDSLIDRSLLDEAKESAEMIYVGKRMDHHSEKQENINKILIEKAVQGKNVVRLKGGDSFVFGRGGEEIAALQSAGIPYDTVPGITSAVAVPESMGIPVTHRGAAQSFTVVTGHTGTETDENYEALAQLEGTLVFLMGLHNIENICSRLIKYGKDKNTPASILSKGFDREQKRINGTLVDIAEKAYMAETPAILVVGSVAAFDLTKTAKLPLEDVSVTVTGSRIFTSTLADRLTEYGAYVTSHRTLRVIAKTDDIPSDFSGYTYMVFTSSNGINVFFEYLRQNNIDYRSISHVRFACIGSGTQRTLRKYGFNADFIPDEYTAESLGHELPKVLHDNDRLLILRAANGSSALTEELEKAGAVFDDIKIYDTVFEGGSINCSSDYIIFASAGGVRAFFESGSSMGKAKPVCIGRITAQELKKYTGVQPLTAKTHTAAGITEVIMEDVKQ